MRSRLVFSCLFLWAAGCAQSGDGAKCTGNKCVDLKGSLDLSTGDVAVPRDMADPNAGLDFSEPADMTRLFQFGEPCSDPLQCQDNFCILSGVTGFCTKQCTTKTDCPTGFDCFGVLGGGIDPGLVVNVCVPDSTLLCTQCATSNECAATGRDLCLASPSGQSFCARDCETVSCPTGFDCKEVTVASKKFKQCLPKSGACDCTAGNQADADPVACDITTPTGTCKGALMCQGDKGWSSCMPPSTDDALDDYLDNNCDGVDGIITDAVFVATTGTDTDGCGLIPSGPCQTITYGSQIAWTFDRHNVYVQAGTYDETVVVIGGVNIVGGFDTNWVRNARTVSGHDVNITGSLYHDSIANRNEYISVVAHDVTTEATLRDLIITAPDASSATGKGSYGIHANNALLKLVNVSVFGGHGGDGIGGANGSPASDTNASDGMNGKPGGQAHNNSSCCDSSEGQRVDGGSQGANSCGGVDTSGGHGGKGGKVDTSCSVCCAGGNCSATSGLAGDAAATVLFSYYGTAGAGGAAENHGSAGKPGYVVNGSGGSGGQYGTLVSGYWTPKNGTDGGTGDNGTGGGGGGGGGGSDQDVDDVGAGGGGGGAGGCAAKTPGRLGTGGGGSFAIFLYASTLTVSGQCKITRGVGGKGGYGGNGALGQAGGGAGAGGDVNLNESYWNIYGGAGGAGAHGAHSGGGGGGAGGGTHAIFYYNSTITGSCQASGGAIGLGGSAGGKAGDGNTGGPGSDGRSDSNDADGNATTYLCSNANSC